MARRLDEESTVGEIICADYNKAAVDELVKRLEKGKKVRNVMHMMSTVL